MAIFEDSYVVRFEGVGEEGVCGARGGGGVRAEHTHTHRVYIITLKK